MFDVPGKYEPAEPGLSWRGTTTYEFGACTVTVFHLTDEARARLTVTPEAGAAFLRDTTRVQKQARTWRDILRSATGGVRKLWSGLRKR